MAKKNKSTKNANLKTYFSNLKIMDIISLILLVASILLGGYVSYQINRYFRISYAIVCFILVFLIESLSFVLMLKGKRKSGLIINIIITLLLSMASFGAYRVSNFTAKVFDNSETETVMVVALKDSNLEAESDFKDKVIGFAKMDGSSTNSFAEEMLTTNSKTGYVKKETTNYKELYDMLLSGDVDMMIYTNQTRQVLLDEDIDSWSNVKVVLELDREMEPVVSKEIDITKDPFNIYISGVDLTSKNINDKGSSDVNIIMTVNPQTKKVIMQTIPRDSWAPLTCENGNHTKLTYGGAWGGINCSIDTIEQMFDIEINYYAKINFQGVVDLVDALGGITVNSDAAFCSSPGSSDCFALGPNTLNGARALTFSRIRKVFSDGDIARGRHQMEVINAVIRKFSEEPSMSHLNSLLGAVENNFTTNLSEDDIGKALELFMSMKNELSNIESYTMKGNMIWRDDEVTTDYLYYFFPNDGEIELVKSRISYIMGM